MPAFDHDEQMRAIIASLILISIAACSNGESDRDRLADRIEKNVVLPQDALSIHEYERYFSLREDGSVIGVFIVLPQGSYREDVADFCRQILEEHDETPFPCPIDGGELRLVDPGERAWVDDPFELPGMSDGGCRQVTVEYLPSENKFLQVACNGSL